MFIRSERLFLRPCWAEDWADIFAGIAQERVVRNLAQAPWPYLPEHARAFAALPQDRHHPHFLITLPGAKGAELVGGAGLHPSLAGRAGVTELGYWIAPRHWGRGFATEAVQALLRLAQALGHRRIEAHHFVDNPASGRVLVKSGFRPTGAVVPLASEGRGTIVPAAAHVIDLNDAGNSDDDGGAMPDGPRETRFAA